MSVPVKLLLSCNLKPGIEEAKTALAYLTQEFSDTLGETGIKLSDVWYTIYGTWPQIRMSFICQQPEILRSFLQSKEWDDLKYQLSKHTQTFRYKVVISRKNFQF